MKVHPLYPTLFGFLLLLVLACFLVMIKNNTFKHYGMLEVVYHKQEDEKELGVTLNEVLSKKKLTSFILTGDDVNDQAVLKLFRKEIQKIKNTGNSDLAVHLHFDKKARWKDVVAAFEICMIEKAPTFVPHEYDLWVMPVAPQKK